MRKSLLLSILILSIFCITSLVQAKEGLNVVVTTQDLADIVRNVGGNRVQVTTICRDGQDPHFVEVKPSYLRSLQKADAFIETGLSLEIGWAPSLLRSAGNTKIMPGNSNFLEASAGIKVLEVPTGKVDRTRGDAHPDGNPHYSLSPTNVKQMARTITAFLKRIDPAGAAQYDNGYTNYWKAIDAADKRWKAALKPYAGASIVTYHSTWIYFTNHFGLKVCGHIEPKPGVSPSSAQLNNLVANMQASHVKVIVAEPWFSKSIPTSLAKRTGCKYLTLPIQPGYIPGTSTYIQMMDYNVNSLVSALSK
ncbi:zinc ABC transporter substrate-binding protein [bacterium]|nr:zinc ABC transporter substrate-binding protein [bacterium]